MTKPLKDQLNEFFGNLPLKLGDDMRPEPLFPVQEDESGLHWNHVTHCMDFLTGADRLLTAGLKGLADESISLWPVVERCSKLAWTVFWQAYWLDTRDRNSYLTIMTAFRTDEIFNISSVSYYCKSLQK